MADKPKPPLWRALHSVFAEWATYAPRPPRNLWAALIRALADWLVPVSDPPASPSDTYAWGMWQKEIALRSILLAEADRAEAG